MREASAELILAPEPFSTRVVRLEASEGATLAQILLGACQLGELDPQDLPRTEIYIDGEQLLDRSAALDVRPAPGQVVNIAVLPQGGGHGSNKILQTVVEVAMIAAAFWLAGPSGVAATKAAATALNVSQTLVRIAALTAISVGGSALLQALGPKASAQGQGYDLETQSNQARLREQMPLCLGRQRWAFDLASSAYSTFVGGDTYITAIYALHYGPCTLEDVKIGETLLSAYDPSEYQVEYRLTPGPWTSNLYPTDIHQDSFTNSLDRLHGNKVVQTTVDNASTAELDFYWAQGLYFPKGDGRIVTCDMTIYIEISPYGANSWTPAPGVGSYPVSAAQKDPLRRTVVIEFPTSGKWDVRVSRNTRPSTDQDADAVTWTAMRTPRPGVPVLDETLSVMVLRVKATQDFSGTLGVVSGVVTPIVPIYTGGNWNTTAPSSNPAALERWLYTGPAAAKPLDPSAIDSSYADQYQLIETQGWHAAVLVKGQLSQQDVSKKLGPAGRFVSYWNGSRLICKPEWEKPVPRQMFAGRNASGFRRKREFPDPVHALWVDFINADEDFKQDGLYVYAPGYDASSATLVEILTLPYACSATRAWKEGNQALTRRFDQVFSYEWTAFADGITSGLGDRVRARRTSALYGQTDARVQNRIWQGALVAGVRLDTQVLMENGQSYALDVRSPDQMLFGLPVAFQAGLSRNVMFATPLTVDAAPLKGDLVAFGRVGTVTEDVEIIDWDPQSDRTIQIKARNYIGPALVSADAGTIPPLTTYLTTRQATPPPRILGSSATPDGAVVDFDIEAQRQSGIRGFSARYRVNRDGQVGDWSTLNLIPATKRQVRTPAIPEAQGQPGSTANAVTVDVEIRTVPLSGEPSSPSQAYAIAVTRGIAVPVNFSAVGVTRPAPDGSTYPAIAVSCDAVPNGSTQDLVLELKQHGAADTTYKSAGTPLHADNPVGDLTAVAGGKVYCVRAKFRSQDNWSSDWVVVDNVTVPSGSLVSSDTTKLGGTASAAVLAAIAAAQADATAALAQIATDNATLTAAVQAAQTDATTALSNISSEVTRALGAEGTLTTNLASLTSTVSANTASISAEAIARANADTALSASISSLSSTVSSNYASLSSSLATLSSAQSATAASVTTLQSQVKINPNLLVNGGPFNGGANWSMPSGWTVGPQQNWGNWVTYTLTGLSGVTSFNYSDFMPCTAGDIHTLSGRTYWGTVTSGLWYIGLGFYNGSGTYLGEINCIFFNGTVQTNPLTGAAYTQYAMDRFQCTGAAPSGTTQMRVHLGLNNVSGGSGYAGIGAQLLKVEAGPVATLFTDDASQVVINATISSEAVTRANADSALAASITSLTSTVNSNTAAISSEATTRAAADAALTSSINTLTSNYNSLSSTVSSNYTTLSTAQATMATAVTALQSQTSNTWPNKLVNGDFSNGLNGWSILSGGAYLSALVDSTVGAFAYCPFPPSDVVFYQDFAATYGTFVLGAEGDWSANNAGGHGPGFCYFQALDAGRSYLGQSSLVSNLTSWGTRRFSSPYTVPVGTQYVRCVVVMPQGSGGGIGRIGINAGGVQQNFTDDATKANTIASIASEAVTRASADSSLASSITSLTATVNGHSASISTNSTAIATLNSSYASLSSTVSTQGASITSNATAISALQGRTAAYLTTTVSGGGAVATFSLAADGFTGSVIKLAADVITIGGNDVMSVSGGVVRIANAVIGGAQIDNASIDTLQLKDNSVTTTTDMSWTGSVQATAGTGKLVDVTGSATTVSTVSAKRVRVSGKISLTTNQTSACLVTIWLMKDGSLVKTVTKLFSGFSGNPVQDLDFYFRDTAPTASGTGPTYAIRVSYSNESGSGFTLTVSAVDAEVVVFKK